MFPVSELGQFGKLLPCDLQGYLPEPGDDWREMEWGLDDVDPCDADTIELLDEIWWPALIRLTDDVRRQVATMQKRP